MRDDSGDKAKNKQLSIDAATRLREPIRLGNRYPKRVQPFTTVRELIDFAQGEAEKDHAFSSLWQRAYEELVKAAQSGSAADLTIAVARFKLTAFELRWLGA